jgi:hypothetical protein
MDPLGFGKLITENWGILKMYPAAFGSVFGFGLIVGLAIVRAFLNERLVGQQNDIVKLRAILEEKLPASFLPQPKRSRPMSFPLILAGLSLAFVGIVIAIGGVIWQLWLPPKVVDDPSAPTVSIATPQGADTPLTKAVNAFLAKQGKTAHWNETIDGHQYVGLGSISGLPGDEVITYWDYASLGPWPTLQDGFGEDWVRTLPKKRPTFKLQSDRENFRGEVGELQKILNQKMTTMLNLSDDLFKSPTANREKISQIEVLYREIDSLLFIRTDHSNGTLFDKSNYKELLMGALSEDWQAYWKNYHDAFVDLKRVVDLLDQARKYPDNTELAALTSNIGPQNELFRDKTKALRFWLARQNQSIELLISAI